MNIRHIIKRSIPFQILTAIRILRSQGWRKNSAPSGVFDEIFAANAWGSQFTVSGPGSEERETEEIRALLPELVRRLDIRSILDAPCGDYSWMQLVDLGDRHYCGVDIVAELIQANQAKYGTPEREFLRADLCRSPLPRANLILCRDCLVHLSFSDAKALLRNFRASGAEYLLITTNPVVKDNYPIRTGGFRNLNLNLPPFRFPEPLEIHRDRYRVASGESLVDPHKHVGLWKVADLRV